MQKHTGITRQRVKSFAAELNQQEKLYPRRSEVGLSVYSAPDRISYEKAIRGKYCPTKIGEQFGPIWSTHWFKVDITIPTDWAGEEVHLLWDSSSEACVWADGVPQQGLTGRGTPWIKDGDRALRANYCIVKSARGGEKITLYIEIACNTLFGFTEDEKKLGQLVQAEIGVFERDFWGLLWDFTVVSDIAVHLPCDTPRAGQALYAANKMINICDLDHSKTWTEARNVAAEFLGARNGQGQHNVSAIGHSHIDTVWLWPLAETKRKVYRSFSTTLRLMEEYPDFKFACSTALYYDWIKRDHPALYEKIKTRVAGGQFIPVGGSWVEFDTNIPSGESLVRQFLYGQQFFKEEFGDICNEFWNPDVFGYNAQLPQIMRSAGMEFFLTCKWFRNQFNTPTSHTFLWEGIDGSRVLVHCPPTEEYSGVLTIEDIINSVKNFKDHERARESYYLFGYGDGGGGPTPGMVEKLRRVKDVDGLPRVEQRSPGEFFARCKADIKDPSVWRGEMYFERHRGTYTTQARNKLHNRLSEVMLHDTEFLAVLNSFGFGKQNNGYPQEELERIWKLVLLNQFHDTIPGSSIREVYADCEIQYRDILTNVETLRTRLVDSIIPPCSKGKNIAVINTLSTPRTEIVDIDDQPTIVSAPPMGYAISNPDEKTAPVIPVKIVDQNETITLENQFVRGCFSRDGRMISLFDKRALREVISQGEKANNLVLFDDRPLKEDAWDVDVFHLEKCYQVPHAKTMRITETTPTRVSIRFEYDLPPTSSLIQTVSLTAASARVDFATEVNWAEEHKFLKVEFPVNVRSDHATYEIQFGHLQRPTHFNTSWDLARFEVCAHHWADLSEPDFGVSLLNDCKYGYAVHGNVMRLSLLRSPKYPDPEADVGRHAFRYALLPHTGTFCQAGVIEEAHRFNSPLIVSRTNSDPNEQSFFSVDNPSVIIDTVKKAENSNAIIVRVYEAHGCQSHTRLTTTLPIQSAMMCNLLETDENPIEWKNNGTDLELTPFQIITLKLVL